METQRTKAQVRSEPCDPTSLERNVRQLFADKVSGNLVGIWLLVPEHLRLGTWDLLRRWTGQPTERVEPRIALQLINEAALCTHALRAKRSLSQKGFELASGLPFVASDSAVHALLGAHTCADGMCLQVGLGKLRRASGHFLGHVIALDPHRIESYSKRQMRRRKSDPQATAAKVMQTFFCLDAETSQPLCLTLTTSGPSVAQATPQLLAMLTDIMDPQPGEMLLIADSEHFAADLIAHVQHDTPLDLLAVAPRQRRAVRCMESIPDEAFTPAWAGYATTKVPFEFADSDADPCILLVQRSGENPSDYERKAFICTADRPELEDLAVNYPQRWHIEEFFNLEDAIGWDRARTMNLDIRYGLMSLALTAQAALYQLRPRLGPPFSHLAAEKLSQVILQGLDGDIRVVRDTIIVTYYNAQDPAHMASQFSGLPDKLVREGVDPRIPWLYDYKLDFRFR